MYECSTSDRQNSGLSEIQDLRFSLLCCACFVHVDMLTLQAQPLFSVAACWTTEVFCTPCISLSVIFEIK